MGNKELSKKYKQIDEQDIKRFIEFCGAAYVHSDLETLKRYGQDETEDLHYPPEVLIKPADSSQVSDILAYCNEHIISVTPIGARTGLSGGALSLFGGVGLSMERFNSITSIDTDNLQATVEPGVITQVFQEAVEAHGLFYPPDPASRGSCFIGGNLAESSGGPKAVKYGVTKDYVLNLEVVLPDGTIMWTGADVLKNATGYDLTRLMVGSEGTLAVITKAVFRLIPLPRVEVLMLVPFDSAIKACEAVSAIFKAGITPSAMEFMERDAIDWVKSYLDLSVDVGEKVQAHLLIELDGNDLNVLIREAEEVAAVLEGYEAGDILFAESAAEKDRLWLMRRRVAEAVKANSVYKEEDTVVPRFRLPQLLSAVKRIGLQYGFKSVCYGHAGDGNLHVNIIKGDMDNEQWEHGLDEGIRALFKEVVAMGGTISGEHGIGLVQKGFMDIAFTERQMDLMRAIKKSFDPHGILNPGKIF
jgi:glycolate oxidase